MGEITSKQLQHLQSKVYDQFALDGVDCVTSQRAMKALRLLRDLGNITEGVLASRCHEKVFLQDWTNLINMLTERQYIKSELRGHGTSKQITLLERGEQFLEDWLGPKQTTEVTSGTPNA